MKVAESRTDQDLVDPVFPDYGGAWIGGIVPALLAGGDPSWLPTVVQNARAVVLLVLDGLGWEAFQERSLVLPTLSAMDGGPITSVVPSTTAAALTSIACGAAPAAHGIVGYRMRVSGRGLNVLRWQTTPDDAVPDPASVQALPPFLGNRVPVITRAEFRNTGFTIAHLRETEFTGWKTVSALIGHVRRSVDEGAPFVYAYYDGVDKVAHEYGLYGPIYETELELTDRLVGDVLDRLPRDTALLVTADHGQVEVGEERAVKLNEIRGLVAAYSGEGRFRSLHARPGASLELESACVSLYGGRAWVLSRERLFDEGWLGPQQPSLAVRGRLGDVVLAARSPIMFTDPGQPKEAKMRSQHGSLTPAEMLVPLLGARGRR